MTDRRSLYIPEHWIGADLSSHELLVLARLYCYWQKGCSAYPSDSYLSDQLNMTVSKVERLMKSLEHKGWISRQTDSHRGSRGGRFRYLYPTEKVGLPVPTVNSKGEVPLKNEGEVPLKSAGEGLGALDSGALQTGGSSSKKPNSRDKAHLIAEMDLPPEIPRSEWRDYVWERHDRGKPMTDRAAALAIKNLRKLHDEGNNLAQVIQQSIMNGWTSIYPVKQNGKGYNGHQQEENPFDGCINRDRWEGPQ